MDIMDVRELEEYQAVQKIAKDTMEHVASFISEGVSEYEIAEDADEFMLRKGASFWYHGVGSLVLVGERTVLSVSGRDYEPANFRVGNEDLVTVDLGPQIDSYWGDFARSFVIGNGRVISTVSQVASKKVIELNTGLVVDCIPY